MASNEIITIMASLILPIISGISSYLLSINKSKRDIVQLHEQNNLDIEKLMNQHKLDLEALERKHQMEIEKMQIEHDQKVELMQKNVENKLNGDLFSKMMTDLLNAPEIKKEMNKSILDALSKKNG